MQQIIRTRHAQSAPLATGVRLNYVEQGDPAGPAIILLHGFSDSSFSWSEVLPKLSPEFHVFALDQRGHGDSDRPLDRYALSDFAADVFAFMDAAGIATATIVGHSMGSWVAQRAASIAPERVERLMLIGTSAGLIPEADELNAAAATLTDPVPVEFVREFQESTIHRPVADAFLDTVVSESLKLPARVWQSVSAAWLPEQRLAEPERLRMPVLILWGDKDAYMPHADQHLLTATLPNATLAIYEETGHALHWEQPQRFSRDLEAFMRGS